MFCSQGKLPFCLFICKGITPIGASRCSTLTGYLFCLTLSLIVSWIVLSEGPWTRVITSWGISRTDRPGLKQAQDQNQNKSQSINYRKRESSRRQIHMRGDGSEVLLLLLDLTVVDILLFFMRIESVVVFDCNLLITQTLRLGKKKVIDLQRSARNVADNRLLEENLPWKVLFNLNLAFRCVWSKKYTDFEGR